MARQILGVFMSPAEFKEALFKIDVNAVEFPVLVDDLLTKIDPTEHQILTTHIFDYFEQHPMEELGMPGSLVHFIESFYPAYAPRLLRSLSDAPNVSAVLMTNRILNSNLAATDRAEYLSALKAVASNTLAKPEVQESARQFLEYQAKQGRLPA